MHVLTALLNLCSALVVIILMSVQLYVLHARLAICVLLLINQ